MSASWFSADLITDRLKLRRLTMADAPSFLAIFSDAEVMRYWSSPPLTGIEQASEKVAGIVAHYASGDLFQLGIIRKTDGRLIGTCTLHQIHLQNRRAEIGYALGREHWGQGYMQEALTAMIDHAFGPLRLHRLEADIDPRNEASARSLERMGFQREGHLRERWIVGDEVSDSWLYGLLAREWAARRADA